MPTDDNRPAFINPTGYDLHMVLGRDLFEFALDPVHPLTYRDGHGYDWQPDRHFLTDRGSIPACVAWLPGYSRNRLAFLFHDSAYNQVDGHGHGLYSRLDGAAHYLFQPMTRARADGMMREMLVAEGLRRTAARAIWCAMRAFGPRW